MTLYNVMYMTLHKRILNVYEIVACGFVVFTSVPSANEL